MKIQRIDDGNFTKLELSLEEFIGSTPYGRFLSDRRFDFQKGINYELKNLEAYFPHGNLFVASTENKEIVGVIGFHFSEWDTKIFAKRIAILQYFLVKEQEHQRQHTISLLNTFHQWVKEHDIKTVIAKLETQYFTPILALQQEGYVIFECITARCLDVSTPNENDYSGPPYRFARASDKEQLLKIAAANTYEKSHFYLDTRFDIEKIDLMYSTWMMNALASDQRIIILEEEDQIAGVFIYDVQDYTNTFGKKIGVWKSAFVDKRFRNAGIGQKLFKATLHACISEGVDIIDTSLAEKNIKSQNIHEVLGFQMTSTIYTFHKWFD